MPLPADRLPPDLRALAADVARIKRDLAELRAARRLPHSTVDSGSVQVTDSAGNVIAEMTTAGGSQNDPGFACYTPPDQDPPHFYSMLSDGYIEFGDVDQLYDVNPTIAHTTSAGSDPAVLGAYSGYVGNNGAFAQALWELHSPADGSGRPYMLVDNSAPGAVADLRVTGVLTAGSIAAGSVNITPSAANTPTSLAVTGLNVQGSTFTAYATALSTAPGTSVTGVSVTGITSTGLTVWLTRSNTTTTTVFWMVIGQ